MSGCPYTWFKSLLKSNSTDGEASALRVLVERDSVKVVDVSLPARSAGWLMELIPSDVVTKIKAEGIPLEAIQDDMARSQKLVPQKIFTLEEPHRVVTVWLE